MLHVDERTLKKAKAKPVFGRWLLAQKNRSDWIGDLARAAHADPKFPADGDAAAVSKRLNQLEADSEMHLALEEAELDWAAM